MTLIQKLEAANWGSEELDVAIQRHLCGYGDDQPLWHCPSYTRSLDTAMTLVPEGWAGELEIGNDEAMTFKAVLWDLEQKYDSVESRVLRSAALAICVASMKAKALL